MITTEQLLLPFMRTPPLIAEPIAAQSPPQATVTPAADGATATVASEGAMYCPWPVVVPLPVPPNTPGLVTVTLLVIEPFTSSRPALMVVAPEYELAALKVSVPAPSLVRAPPMMGSEMVRSLAADELATVKVVGEANATLPVPFEIDPLIVAPLLPPSATLTVELNVSNPLPSTRTNVST